MISPVVSFTPRIGCILIQKHDIGAEDVFSAIPDLRALVEETLVAMSRRRLYFSISRVPRQAYLSMLTYEEGLSPVLAVPPWIPKLSLCC
jgi:hypothetical protein